MLCVFRWEVLEDGATVHEEPRQDEGGQEDIQSQRHSVVGCSESFGLLAVQRQVGMGGLESPDCAQDYRRCEPRKTANGMARTEGCDEQDRGQCNDCEGSSGTGNSPDDVTSPKLVTKMALSTTVRRLDVNLTTRRSQRNVWMNNVASKMTLIARYCVSRKYCHGPPG